MMTNLNISARDFVKGYSNRSEAELHLHIVREMKPSGKKAILFMILGLFSGSDTQRIYNDLRLKNYFHLIKRKYGNLTQESALSFLREKFKHDHLRKHEYPFFVECINRIDLAKKKIADIGGANSISTLIPALLGLKDTEVISIDVLNSNSSSKYGISYIKGDSMNTNLADGSVDIVSVLSTLEHIGLGRWGDPLDVDGDIKAMKEIRRILKPGGHCILTVPYGFPSVIYNMNRIYDDGRLERLIDGFIIILERFTFEGQVVEKSIAVDRKATKVIKDFYLDIPIEKRAPDSPSGVMLFLRKS